MDRYLSVPHDLFGSDFHVQYQVAVGTCNIVYRGITRNGEAVALRTFNDEFVSQHSDADCMALFSHEIDVLSKLGLVRNQHDGVKDLSSRREARNSMNGVASLTSTSPRDVLISVVTYYPQKNGNGDSLTNIAPKSFTAIEWGRCTLMEDVIRRRVGVHNRGKSIPYRLEEVAYVIRCVAEGLSWIHNQGYLHFDVNSSNLMRVGKFWKLIDLELAIPLGQRATVPAGSISLDYASPELAAKLSSSDGEMCLVEPIEAMDVWGIGTLLLDMLLGRCSAIDSFLSKFSPERPEGKNATIQSLTWTDDDFAAWLADDEIIMLDVGKSRAERGGYQELKDLLRKMLTKDANDRISINGVLEHNFIKDVSVFETPQSGFDEGRLSGATVSSADASKQLQKSHSSVRKSTGKVIKDFMRRRWNRNGDSVGNRVSARPPLKAEAIPVALW